MRAIAVDDKPVPRRALVRALEEAEPGIEITACASAEEVLALSDLGAYDVAFVDTDLPGKSGIQLARELKASHPLLNIVFATGFGEFMADAFALHSSGYLMKPITAEKVRRELDDLRHVPTPRDTGKLVARCFGDFEVFAQGEPVTFERSRTKELLAYLIDRRGSVVGMRKVEAALWGDTRDESVSSSYLRTLAADLRNALAAHGFSTAVVRRYGEIGIDTAQVSCDYYDLLAGDPLAISAWHGEYMSQYSWAEETKAALVRSLGGENIPFI